MSQKLFLALTLTLSLFTSINAIYGDNCQVQFTDDYWNLDALKNNNWQANYVVNDTENPGFAYNYTIYVSFCGSLTLTDPNFNNSICNNGSGQTVAFSTTWFNISNVTQANITCTNAQTTEDPDWEVLDSEDYESGLIATFPASNSTTQFTTTVNLECDSTGSLWQVSGAFVNTSSNQIVINASSTEACVSFSGQMIWQFMTKYQAIFIPLFCILGLFECFFGRKMLGPTLFIVGAVFAFFVILMFLFAVFVEYNTSTLIKVVLFVVALLPSVVVGFVVYKLKPVGIFILGALLGVVVVLLAYTAILSYSDPADYVLYILLGLGGLIFGGLAYWLKNGVVIVATSLLGSYGTIRALSIVIGGFPNEFTIVENVEKYGNPEVTWKFYVYLAFILLLAIGGGIFQLKTKKEEDEKEQDEDPNNRYGVLGNLPV